MRRRGRSLRVVSQASGRAISTVEKVTAAASPAVRASVAASEGFRNTSSSPEPAPSARIIR